MLLFYKLLLLINDLIIVNFSFISALFLTTNAPLLQPILKDLPMQLIVVTFISLLCHISFKSYSCMLRYITSRELLYLLAANLSSIALFFMYGQMSAHPLPLAVYPLFLCINLLLAFISRFSYKFIHRITRKISKKYHTLSQTLDAPPLKRTLIIGAGDAAAIIIRESKNIPDTTYHIVCALDDDKSKLHSSLNGVPVRGQINELEQVVEKQKIAEILIALPSASKQRLGEIIHLCNKTHLPFKIFPGVSSTLTSEPSLNQLRKVKREDLLGRDEIVLNNPDLATIIHQHTILVTGGGGSIGSELCRQIASYQPKRLIIFDIYENNAYDIQNELLQNGLDPTILTVIIGSVRDFQKVDTLFKTYRPSLVFHAAAHKHVPLMEFSPEEAIKNNVFGTLNVALCAKRHKVHKFILISTDKAVNPTNIMGASKRLCEMIVQSINATTSKTQFVAVRFGNVLGSNGSVIPLFKRQLEAGGPLTVTDKEIIRYFMTIPEAVSLILQATSFAKGGEIFILDMGDPVKIYDLALNFIRLSGLEPFKDIDITFTGLRPGEKLYEELLMSEEGLTQTTHEKIFIAQPLNMTFAEIEEKLNYLRHLIEVSGDIREGLAHVVPTYKPSPITYAQEKRAKHVS